MLQNFYHVTFITSCLEGLQERSFSSKEQLTKCSNWTIIVILSCGQMMMKQNTREPPVHQTIKHSGRELLWSRSSCKGWWHHQLYQADLAQNLCATGRSFKHSQNCKVIVWQSQSEHLDCTAFDPCGLYVIFLMYPAHCLILKILSFLQGLLDSHHLLQKWLWQQTLHRTAPWMASL